MDQLGEIVLQKIIKQGLVIIQSDQVLLNRLMQDLDASVKDTLLNYLTQKEVAVHLGFGREPWEAPQISITLASESEQRYVGDELAIRDLVLDVSAGTGQAITSLDTPPFALPFTNLMGGTFAPQGRLQIDNEQFTYNSIAASSFNIVARRVRRTQAAFHAIGSTIFARQLESSLGSDALRTYRIDVLADNADVVLWLQPIVRNVLFMKWRELDDAGFGQLQLSASDFMPRPQFYPMFIYQRSIMLETRITESIPQALVEALSFEIFPTLEGVQGPFTLSPEIPLGS